MSTPIIQNVTVQDGALGAIVESTTTRKHVYTVWILIGLALQGIAAAIIAGAGTYAAAAALGLPWWVCIGAAILGGIAGAYAALTPQVATLARANTSTPLDTLSQAMPAITTLPDPATSTRTAHQDALEATTRTEGTE